MNSEHLSDLSNLALAAYASLNGEMTNAQAADALRTVGFTDTQSNRLLDRYRIVTQYADDASLLVGNGTSLSVTVFKNAATNHLTVAVRGTDDAADLPTGNYSIIGGGAAYPQIAALYNWWLRASATPGSLVPQYRVVIDSAGSANPLEVFGGFLVRIDDAAATGELRAALAADPDGQVDVTGHSLGGHLSMAFGALFPALVGSVTAFNAPGFRTTTTNHAFFTRLAGVTTAVPALGDPKITNVIADEARQDDVGLNPIAGFWSTPGTVVRMPIEDQWLAGEPEPPDAKNHSQLVLADTLAVWHLLNRLQTSMPVSQYDSLLQLAANREHASLESLVGSLRQLLGIGSAELPAGNGIAARESLYQALDAIAQSPALGILDGKVRVDPSSSDLRAKARNDFSALASLLTLSPVVLTATTTANQAVLDSVFLGAWGQTYQAWLADMSMSLADRQAGKETFSDKWVADRATFLTAVVAKNGRDESFGTTSYRDGLDPVSSYVDLKTGATINSGDQGSTRLAQIVFGSDATDTRDGDSRGDRLYDFGVRSCLLQVAS